MKSGGKRYNRSGNTGEQGLQSSDFFTNIFGAVLNQCINKSPEISTSSERNELVREMIDSSIHETMVLLLNQFSGAVNKSRGNIPIPETLPLIGSPREDILPEALEPSEESVGLDQLSECGQDLQVNIKEVQKEGNPSGTEGNQAEAAAIPETNREERAGLVEKAKEGQTEEKPVNQTTASIIKELGIIPEVIETNDFVLIRIKVPQGMREEDLRISVSESTAVIKWYNRYFEQIIKLPSDCLVDNVSAIMENSVLEVKIPRVKSGNSRAVNVYKT